MFNAYTPCSSTSSNSGLTNELDAIALTKDYFQSKDIIYKKLACDSNCTNFIKTHTPKYPHLLKDILVVNLFFGTWTQTILGAYLKFVSHVFLMVHHDNEWHALDYDLQKFFGRNFPLDKIPAIDYLARILNTDRTVAHLNELVSTPDKKSDLLPLFRVFTVDEWHEFSSTIGCFITGIRKNNLNDIPKEAEKNIDFNKIPVINFYEFFQFLKEKPPATNGLVAKYNNSGYMDADNVLANVRLNPEHVGEFLELLRKYPSIDFNGREPRLVPALDGDEHASKIRAGRGGKN